MVGVEEVDEDLGLTLCNVNSHVFDAPVELLLIELSVATVINDFEHAAHASDGLSTTRLETGSNLIEDCTRLKCRWGRYNFDLLTFYRVL